MQVEGAEKNEPNTIKTKKESNRKNKEVQFKTQQETQDSLKNSPDPALAQKSPDSNTGTESPESNNTKKTQPKNQTKKESSNKKKKEK